MLNDNLNDTNDSPQALDSSQIAACVFYLPRCLTFRPPSYRPSARHLQGKRVDLRARLHARWSSRGNPRRCFDQASRRWVGWRALTSVSAVASFLLDALSNACGHVILWRDKGGPHKPLTWIKEGVWQEGDPTTRPPSTSSVAVSEGLQSSRDSQAGLDRSDSVRMHRGESVQGNKRPRWVMIDIIGHAIVQRLRIEGAARVCERGGDTAWFGMNEH